MIDLTKLHPSEAERIAYAEGFTMAAELFKRIADLQAERDALQDALDQCQIDLYAAQRERVYGGEA